MFYFVNQYLLSSNSSIEHRAIKQVKLFKRNDAGAKLVTLDFDPILHATVKRFGLEDNQVINLYDFFAQTTDYAGHQLFENDLNLSPEYQIGAGEVHEVKKMDRLVAKIYFIGGTLQQVDHVEYYDAAGNITLRERYDYRGFKAVDQFLGQNGEIHNERYYRPDGQVYLEKFYVQSTQNTPINSLNVLKNYNGRDYYFDDPNGLATFFLEQLDKSNNEQNTFIADRPAVSIPSIAAMQSPDAKKYISIPFNHVAPGTDPVKGQLNGLISNAITNDNSQWDGVIVDTKKQQADLQRRLGKKLPVYAVNASPVSHARQKLPLSLRRAKQITYVGRLAEDKGTGNLLNIFAEVHKKVPDAQLALYGYGSQEDTQKYKVQVKNNGLENSVIFAGYQPFLENAYNGSQLFIDTSISDAEPLAMAEALEHGVPVISYDYPYGPNELIQPGMNGELVPLNDTNRMIKTIVDLLNDSDRLQKLSDGAYANLDTIDNQSTWQQWQKLISD